MDDILWAADEYLLTPYVYPETLPPENFYRQTFSLFWITTFGGWFMYLAFAALNFHFVFDKVLLKHPKILKNQIRREIAMACWNIPGMSVLTLPFFLAEVRGYTKLYERIDERSLEYTVGATFAFLMWNDCLVYWVHRALHHPILYKRIHKDHHKWLVPTPFASHAFHAIDGCAQALPYHLFVLFVPYPKWLYMGSFLIVNFWTISIHDALYAVPKALRPFINGAAHHTDHHLFFNYNYGLYFTLWDRIGGSFRNPSPFEGNGPYDHLQKLGILPGEKETAKTK